MMTMACAILKSLFLRGWSFGKNTGLTMRMPVTNMIATGTKRNVESGLSKKPLALKKTIQMALIAPANVEGTPEK